MALDQQLDAALCKAIEDNLATKKRIWKEVHTQFPTVSEATFYRRVRKIKNATRIDGHLVHLPALDEFHGVLNASSAKDLLDDIADIAAMISELERSAKDATGKILKPMRFERLIAYRVRLMEARHTHAKLALYENSIEGFATIILEEMGSFSEEARKRLIQKLSDLAANCDWDWTPPSRT